MNNPTGFKWYARKTIPYRKPEERISGYREFTESASEKHLKIQSARCMDCGIPFCLSVDGCPIRNLIPEWNDLVYSDRWRHAIDRLHQTNNFPEFTGRVCPAPCEGACTLGFTESPVTIKNIEYTIIERAFENEWVVPCPPSERTGKTVAVIGSGPAGLAAAAQLNSVGHTVTVYERDPHPGGLLMYGIPNMKLDKEIIARRIRILKEEGISFACGKEIGKDLKIHELREKNDAVLLAVGSTRPRDLSIPGRELNGIHFAMDYLTHSTMRVLDPACDIPDFISAKGKDVIVVGGGDTGNDCIGTAIRQGCRSVVNFELLPKPPRERAADNPWPAWPKIFRTDYGHQEAIAKFGKDPRLFSMSSTNFVSDRAGNVSGVNTVRVEWSQSDGRWQMQEVEGSEGFHSADLILLALGFLGPEETIASQLSLDLDNRSNFEAQFGEFQTSQKGVFAAGDCRRGQSLVVHAIHEGRQAARAIDIFLMGNSTLTKLP